MSITSPFAGATGVFEEADYTSSGGDLAELKTYLLGRALWNPLAYTDDDAARDEREFLTAFYGAGAAPHIKQYMEIFVASANATRTYLGESAPVDADYLTPAALLDGADELEVARIASSGDVERRARRVDVASLSVRYAVLLRWDEMQAHAAKEERPWPYETALQDAYDTFKGIYEAAGMTALSEWTPDGCDDPGLSCLCFLTNVSSC